MLVSAPPGYGKTTLGIVLEYQNPQIGEEICLLAAFCVSAVTVVEPYQWFGCQAKRLGKQTSANCSSQAGIPALQAWAAHVAPDCGATIDSTSARLLSQSLWRRSLLGF
jgi:KaiC/GvpD/RAD55 family RecA-like ATPase